MPVEVGVLGDSEEPTRPVRVGGAHHGGAHIALELCTGPSMRRSPGGAATTMRRGWLCKDDFLNNIKTASTVLTWTARLGRSSAMRSSLSSMTNEKSKRTRGGVHRRCKHAKECDQAEQAHGPDATAAYSRSNEDTRATVHADCRVERSAVSRVYGPDRGTGRFT